MNSERGASDAVLAPVHRVIRSARDGLTLFHTDGLVRRWTQAGGPETFMVLDQPVVDMVPMTVDGERAYAVADALGVCLRDRSGRAVSKHFGPDRGQPTGVADAGGAIVVADNEGALVWWSGRNRRKLRTQHVHRKSVHTLQPIVLADNRAALLTASDDRTVAITDTASGQLVRRFSGHIGWVGRCVAVETGVGHASALATVDRAWVRLWEVASGSQVGGLSIDGRRVSAACAALDPTGTPTAAVGFIDGCVATIGTDRRPPDPVHHGRVTGVASIGAGPGRVAVASSGVDGRVVLNVDPWGDEPGWGYELASGPPVDHLASDGSSLLAIHDDGTVTCVESPLAS